MATSKLVSIAWFLGLLVLDYLGRWVWSVRSVFSRCTVLLVGARPVSRPAGRSAEEGGRPPHTPLLALTYREGDTREVGE